ncbi:TetR/AcrR family transcriptional regulator [Sutcliffiella halmapala]|uniref:TetR/AcrR family transcriptional regulator n=1 Tax=Sutcliffiella halmapala TaxID=79882 RepID=UPI000994DD85|nr:TetR/AcrR family transcriptional regulator [Sutcliffiella halmapala]
MNDRKQHVITCAHKLFIDKGFQATSIQDILEFSGISKGTFYNYFASKNELLIELFRSLYKKMEQERNELLIGQDSANITIFIQQIELQMETNHSNKLISLFEEVYFLNDKELKEFIKRGQIRMIRWIYQRFLEIFGEQKRPYLLDCSIMFLGILNNNIRFFGMAYEAKIDIHRVVRYSVERIVKIVHEVAESKDYLLQPSILERWAPDTQNKNQATQHEVMQVIITLKQAVQNKKDQLKYTELLDFIHDELLHSKKPRKFLIDSAVVTLKDTPTPFPTKELQTLDQLMKEYFKE